MAGFNIRHKNIALRALGLDEAAAVGLFAEGAADLADVYVSRGHKTIGVRPLFKTVTLARAAAGTWTCAFSGAARLAPAGCPGV